MGPLLLWCFKYKAHPTCTEALKQRLLSVGDFRATGMWRTNWNPQDSWSWSLQAAPRFPHRKTRWRSAAGVSPPVCRAHNSPSQHCLQYQMSSKKGLKLQISRKPVWPPPHKMPWRDNPLWLPHYSSPPSRYRQAWFAGLEIGLGVLCQLNRLSYNRAWLVFTLAS